MDASGILAVCKTHREGFKEMLGCDFLVVQGELEFC
jgi:hypothetical protein